MKTPFSVYLVGVLECIGGVLVLLMSVGMLYVSLAKPVPVPRGSETLLLVSAFYGLLGTLGVATGICVCLRKNWARWSTLIFSWFSIFMVGITGLAFLVVPLPSSKIDMGAFRIVSAGVSFLFAAMFGWWIWLFTRTSIKQVFLEGREEPSGGRPLSISVLGWLWIVSGGMMCLMLVAPMTLGAWVLTGWKAVIVKVAWGAAYVVLGWGLLKLREWARRGSIALLLLGMLNSVVFFFMPGRAERMRELTSYNMWNVQRAPAMEMPPQFLVFLGVLGILCVGIPIYFLVARKAAFAEHAVTLPPPPPIPGM